MATATTAAATTAQHEANQANAAHSTGPRTAAGKAASSRNAFRHGFRSQSVLIPGDDPAEYQALLDELTAHFSPGDRRGPDLTELRYIREMADAEWRLRRARAHQEHLLTTTIANLAAAHPDLDPLELQVRAHEQLSAESAYFRRLLTYEEKFERQYDRAHRGWTRYQDARRRVRREHADLLVKETIFAPVPSTRPAANPQDRTNEPNPAPAAPKAAPESAPRNAPCPCGSGVKYKRCCGEDAPPHLGRAA